MPQQRLSARELAVLSSIYSGAYGASGSTSYAAGLASQAYFEKADSGFNPMRTEDGGSSYGIFNTGSAVWNQWVSYAKANGIDYKSPDSAGDYAAYITQTFQRVAPQAADRAFNAQSPSEALNAYRSWNYGGTNTGERNQFANQFGQQMQAGNTSLPAALPEWDYQNTGLTSLDPRYQSPTPTADTQPADFNWSYDPTGQTGYGDTSPQPGFSVNNDPMGYSPTTENRNTWQDIVDSLSPYPGGWPGSDNFASSGSQSVGGNLSGYDQNGDFYQPYQTQSDFNSSLGQDYNSNIYSWNTPDYGSPAPYQQSNPFYDNPDTSDFENNYSNPVPSVPYTPFYDISDNNYTHEDASQNTGGTDIQEFGGNLSLGENVPTYHDYETTPVGPSFYDQNALENGTGGWNSAGQWEYYNQNPSDYASASSSTSGRWNPSDYNSASGSSDPADFWDYSNPGYGTGTGYANHDEPPSDVAPGLGTYGPGGFNPDYMLGGQYYDDGMSVFAGMTPGAQIGYSNFAQEDPRTGAMLMPAGGGINFGDWGTHPLILR